MTFSSATFHAVYSLKFKERSSTVRIFDIKRNGFFYQKESIFKHAIFKWKTEKSFLINFIYHETEKNLKLCEF